MVQALYNHGAEPIPTLITLYYRNIPRYMQRWFLPCAGANGAGRHTKHAYLSCCFKPLQVLEVFGVSQGGTKSGLRIPV